MKHYVHTFLGTIILFSLLTGLSGCQQETTDNTTANTTMPESIITTSFMDESASVAYPGVVSDGDGGAIVVYGELTPDDDQLIHIQRIDRSGKPLWGSVLGRARAFFDERLLLVSDANGGVLTYGRISVPGKIEPPDETILRVNSQGDIVWQTDLPVNCKVEQICADDSGNAFIAYTKTSQRNNLYIQRTGDNGTFFWEEPGILLRRNNVQFATTRLIADGSGGVIIMWNELDNGSRFCGQRVDTEGNFLWEGQSFIKKGKVFYTTSRVVDGQQIQLIPDGFSGALLNWIEYTAGESNVKVMRVDNSGEPVWMSFFGVTDGSTGSDYVAFPFISRDESGDILLLWSDFNSLYAQKLDSSGYLQWPQPIVAIRNDPDMVRIAVQTVPDGSGKVIVSWGYAASESIQEKELRVYKIDSKGEILWSDEIPVGTEEGIYAAPGSLASDGDSGTFLVWVTGPIAPSMLSSAIGGGFYSPRDSFIQKYSPAGVPLWEQGGIHLEEEPVPSVGEAGSSGIPIGRFLSGDVLATIPVYPGSEPTTCMEWKQEGGPPSTPVLRPMYSGENRPGYRAASAQYKVESTTLKILSWYEETLGKMGYERRHESGFNHDKVSGREISFKLPSKPLISVEIHTYNVPSFSSTVYEMLVVESIPLSEPETDPIPTDIDKVDIAYMDDAESETLQRTVTDKGTINDLVETVNGLPVRPDVLVLSGPGVYYTFCKLVFHSESEGDITMECSILGVSTSIEDFPTLDDADGLFRAKVKSLAEAGR
ncbi:MAG: hypothetical protein JW712_04980 [Dehalococcoidales bacterium]|nr:hypothetical protein [Dehalococcoidales bacterium]